MKREYHRWYSPRLGIDMGVIVHGHWGQPILGFPTSAGDETELEGQSMIGALADFIEVMCSPFSIPTFAKKSCLSFGTTAKVLE